MEKPIQTVSAAHPGAISEIERRTSTVFFCLLAKEQPDVESDSRSAGSNAQEQHHQIAVWCRTKAAGQHGYLEQVDVATLLPRVCPGSIPFGRPNPERTIPKGAESRPRPDERRIACLSTQADQLYGLAARNVQEQNCRIPYQVQIEFSYDC